MAQLKRVIYRGISMIEGWPEKIVAAQQILSLAAEGRTIPRIRYGDEHDDWGANEHACHDCRVLKNEFHVPGCDGEECPLCGGQLITCDCPFDDRAEDA
jgi:hypothetical protein